MLTEEIQLCFSFFITWADEVEKNAKEGQGCGL